MDDYLKIRERDVADLMDELAGRPNGKHDRFLTGDASLRDPGNQERERRDRFFFYVLGLYLQQLLERAYARAWDALERAQTLVDHALLETAKAADHLNSVIAGMEARALRTGDGALVFEDASDRWRTADGRHLRAEDAAALSPSARDRANAPKWEAWRDARQARAAVHERRADLVEKAQVLDRSRAQLERRDLDLEAIEALEQDITALIADVERKRLSPAFDASAFGQPASVSEAAADLPDFSIYKP